MEVSQGTAAVQRPAGPLSPPRLPLVLTQHRRASPRGGLGHHLSHVPGVHLYNVPQGVYLGMSFRPERWTGVFWRLTDSIVLRSVGPEATWHPDRHPCPMGRGADLLKVLLEKGFCVNVFAVLCKHHSWAGSGLVTAACARTMQTPVRQRGSAPWRSQSPTPSEHVGLRVSPDRGPQCHAVALGRTHRAYPGSFTAGTLGALNARRGTPKRASFVRGRTAGLTVVEHMSGALFTVSATARSPEPPQDCWTPSSLSRPPRDLQTTPRTPRLQVLC